MTSTMAHDDHLRYLLDQRAARADLHGTFPSQSDFSDSPSLYSHGPFSPQPADNDAHSVAFHYTVSSPNPSVPSPDPRSPVTDRERLNYPEASSLDLDDDSQSSLFYSVEGDDDNSSQASLDDGAEGEEARISTYGPKMRFHSPAPWETGEDDDVDDSASSRKKKHSASKKANAAKKAWGLSSKTSFDGRPSTESNRSQAKGKQSLDSATSSNGGALLALAQASVSSTSLVLSPSHQTSATLRDKLTSFPRLRTRTGSSTKGQSRLDSFDTQSITSVAPSYSAHPSPRMRYRSPSPSESLFSQTDVGPPFSSPPSPRSPIHPYANPDLVRHTTFHDNVSKQNLHQLHALASSTTALPAVAHSSDSAATLTDSTTTSTMSQSGSESTVTLTPVTSMSSMQSKQEMPPPQRSVNVQNRGISAPISMNVAGMRAFPSPLPTPAVPPSGWMEPSNSAQIKLISLAEAQAQARERSRTATAGGSSVAVPHSGPSHSYEHDALPSPTVPNANGWSRMRSASAGSSKSKNVANPVKPIPPLPAEHSTSSQNQEGNNSSPPKVLGRKKSGFMRLFNGKERPQAIQQPPPLPSPTYMPPPSPGPPVPRKTHMPRVPVPSLPSEMESANTGGSAESSSDRVNAGSTPQQQLSARRNAPGLSIVTHPPGSSAKSNRSASPVNSESTHHGHFLTPTTAASGTTYVNSSIPQSAPPTSADFLGVNIRPVSTLFSKNFSEHLRFSADQARPSLETDRGTPTTASAISPMSPAFPNEHPHHQHLHLHPHHPSEEKNLPVGIASQQEDQSSVIQALQEQIMTARRAWQRQIWELEGQVRDLKAEVDGLRLSESSQEYCAACGRGSNGRPTGGDAWSQESHKSGGKSGGVVNRPRARTGVGTRFASGI